MVMLVGVHGQPIIIIIDGEDQVIMNMSYSGVVVNRCCVVSISDAVS
jgi:hypothetical protein